MTVRRLPRAVPVEKQQPDDAVPDHPMRRITRRVATVPREWTQEQATEVRDYFDRLAPEWQQDHNRPERLVPIVDALDRGGPFADGLAVELGSGTGIATPAIAARLPRLVAVDLSKEMLRLAPDVVARVNADGSRLPFRDEAVATLVLVNMLLFPAEVDRVLARRGAVVWVSTAGPSTPIYLSPEEIDAALPGDWDIVSSEAGAGTWCVARRSRTEDLFPGSDG